MTFYLLDHPNPTGPNYYTTRRNKLIAIVVHVTAGLEDLDLIAPDLSCENVCHYAATTTRDVSWHSGSDSDTWIDLLPYSYTAWQCVNYNSSTAGHEISKLTTDWRNMPAEWVRRTITIAALGLGRKARENGIPIRKATKAEVDKAIANGGPPVGFISHHELDPDRRTDPGWVNGIDTFPWDTFLSIAQNGDDDLPTPADVWNYGIKNPDSGAVMKASDRLLDIERRVGLLFTVPGAIATLTDLVKQDAAITGDDERNILAAIKEVSDKVTAITPTTIGEGTTNA